jgi:hypothetical protein
MTKIFALLGRIKIFGQLALEYRDYGRHTDQHAYGTGTWFLFSILANFSFLVDLI